jgi:ribosomal protein S12 methylthiotransferase accessory factor
VAAADLAAAGVGAIHVLDDERVTDDDLLGVRFFGESDLGRGRTDALRRALSRSAPGCAVTSEPLRAEVGHALALEDTRWDLILACVPGDDLLALQSAARFAHAARAVSLSGHLDGLDAVIGPAVVPGETACWNCCRLRRLANSLHPSEERALQASLLAERPRRRARTHLSPTAGLLGHALALAALDLCVAPRAAPLAGRILVRNLLDLSTSVHAVLRLPSCDVCGGAGGALDGGLGPEASSVRLDAARDPAELRRMLAGVVDVRTGIVQDLAVELLSPVRYPEMPRTAVAAVGSPAACPDRDDRPEVGAGKGITVIEAMIGAVGEAIERYSAERFDPRRLLRSSGAELTAEHIAPDELCFYEECQYARTDFPYVRLDERTPLDWVLGSWLDTGSPVYVPALPAYFAYPVPLGEAFCQVTSNGLAAGATRADAAMRAALELVERDAFMISWLARLPGRRIHLDESIDPGTREVARQLADRGARLELYLVDAGVGVPAAVSIGFGDGRRWPGATVAMAAHLSPRRAIRKAVLEQGHVGPYLRRLMIEATEAVPERPEDVRTLSDHARYYFPPSRAAAFAFLGRGGAAEAAELEEPEDASLDALVGRVRAAGLRVAVVDVTSPDLAPTPFRVVRALGPRFQQIHFGHALAQLENPRLLAMAPHGINPDPHPMA